MRFLSGFVIVIAVSCAFTVLGEHTVVRACSCAMSDPVDMVSNADVVFSGTAVENLGDDMAPRWRFSVDGVVKGEVASEEVVDGEDWAVGCGTDFSRFSVPIVVYASDRSGQLAAIGCSPTPTAEAFATTLTELENAVAPSGAGIPAAVAVGRVHDTNVRVFDALGAVLAAGVVDIEPGAVAHCPGTDRIAVWTQGRPVESDEDPDGPMVIGSSNNVSIVELSTMSVVQTRPLLSEWVSFLDSMVCVDGGERVVVGRGQGPNSGSVTVASSNGDPSLDSSQDLTGVNRAVIHPSGSVVLVPSIAGGDLVTLSGARLNQRSDVPLPLQMTGVNGGFSADGTRFAMLVTLTGDDAEYDTGATHVQTFDIVDGVATADGSAPVPLDPAPFAGQRAQWIAWVDADTWAIESETDSTKILSWYATTGRRLSAHDVGWGHDLVVFGDRIMRTRAGGIELIAADGASTALDPEPVDEYVDRLLDVTAAVNAPLITVESVAGTDLSIRPVSAATVDDEVAVDPTGDEGGLTVQAAFAGAALIGVLVFGLRAVKRQREEGRRSKFPPIG